MVMELNETTDNPKDQTNARNHASLGPYENWMMDVGKFYDLPGLMLDHTTSLSCIAEFKQEITYDAFQAASILTAGTSKRIVLLPTLHKNKDILGRFVPFLLAPDPNNPLQEPLMNRTGSEIAANFNAALVNPGGPFEQGAQLRLNLPVRQDTVNTAYNQDNDRWPPVDAALQNKKPKVILAIIDLGIPFAHANFRHAGTDKTRVDYCWVQSAPAEPDAKVLFGREFTRDRIDAWVDAHGTDEDAIYQEAGVLSRPGAPPMPLSRKHSHGAHVLDTFAGHWDAATEAQARIIAVDLPASSTWETSGFGKDMFILSALHYIFDRALLLESAYGCGPLPLVINLSYGYSGGPHDGTGLIEDAIAELIGKRKVLAPTFIIMPSGNMFQDRLFAQITEGHFGPDPSGEQVATLHWLAPPDDRTSSYIEFWYPEGTDLTDVRLELTTPAGQLLPLWECTKNEYFAANIEVGNKIVGQITIDRSRKLNPASRIRATVILAPTEPPAKDDYLTKAILNLAHVYAPAPAGRWTVRFFMSAGRTLPGQGIACRIQRDTSYGQGNTGAQQGYFMDPVAPRYDDQGKLATVDDLTKTPKLRRFGSLNGMATHDDTVVVGGHSIRREAAAAYSSPGGTGPTAPQVPAGRQVDLSAASERSAFAPGMTAAGTRSGITVAFQGTSTSAPQVARALGAALVAGRAATVDDCLALLAQAGVTRPVTDLTDSPAGQPRLGRVLLTTAPPIAGSEQIDAQGPG